MALAESEKAIKAKVAASNKFKLVICPTKNNGIKMKKFFMY